MVVSSSLEKMTRPVYYSTFGETVALFLVSKVYYFVEKSRKKDCKI